MKAMVAAGARSSHLHLVPVAAQAAEDCVGMLEDAVDLLQQSVEAMERLGKEEPSGVSGQGQAGSGSRSVRFQVNSVQTWASAALTNDDMCMEGFKGQPAVVREAVRGNVAGVTHLTAIALAIINAMAKQYKLIRCLCTCIACMWDALCICTYVYTSLFVLLLYV